MCFSWKVAQISVRTTQTSVQQLEIQIEHRFVQSGLLCTLFSWIPLPCWKTSWVLAMNAQNIKDKPLFKSSLDFASHLAAVPQEVIVWVHISNSLGRNTANHRKILMKSIFSKAWTLNWTTHRYPHACVLLHEPTRISDSVYENIWITACIYINNKAWFQCGAACTNPRHWFAGKLTPGCRQEIYG